MTTDLSYDPAESNTRTFVPAPPGVHVSVLVDVIDEGMKEQTWEGRTRMVRKLRLVWQLPVEIPNNDGTRFTASKRYTASLHPKSALRKDLESWRGSPYPDEKIHVNLEGLIGTSAMVQIQHKAGVWQGKETTYANVTAVLPSAETMEAVNYIRVQDRDRDAETETATRGTEIHDDDIPF